MKKIALVYKHFKSEEEMIEYTYNQQLHRRNLSEQKIFKAYKQLRELTNADGKKAKTDVQIAEELNISPRQIAKMKEVKRKASLKVMEAFTEGTISLNQAYNQMKEEIKPADATNLSVAEYAMKILMDSVHIIPATEPVSEQETT